MLWTPECIFPWSKCNIQPLTLKHLTDTHVDPTNYLCFFFCSCLFVSQVTVYQRGLLWPLHQPPQQPTGKSELQDVQLFSYSNNNCPASRSASITDILLPFTDTLAWENCNVVHHQYFTTTSDMHLATDTDIDTVFLNPIKYVTKTGHLTILICFYIILGITNDITLFLLNVT